MTETKKGSIYQRILDVQSEVGAVEKKGRNEFHKYDYAKEEDFLHALKPLFEKHGLAVMQIGATQEVIGTLTCVATKYRVASIDSDEHIDVDMVGQGSASDDKGAYKALTGSMKYFLAKFFLIPTGDDPEKDSPVDKGGKKGTAAATGRKTGGKASGNVGIALTMIGKAASRKKLEEWKTKAQTSTVYSEDEKKQVIEAIDKRIAGLPTDEDVPA